MLSNKSFVRKTRHGRVIKVVREHYLRDDISCGALFCPQCDTSKAALRQTAENILVVDTNVVLHQMDLLENEIISDVVVLSVVLEEVKNKNLSLYNRLRAIIDNPTRHFFVFANEHHKDTYIKALAGETPNDRNDRAIRVATQWYQEHLGPSAKVILLTNDMDNRSKARESGIVSETVQAYVQSLGKPELLDLVARSDAMDIDKNEAEDLRPNKKAVVYAEHKVMSEITAGLHQGRYHQGKLRVNRYNPFVAYVGSESVGEEILINGRQDMNRAFDGDVVAVELLPQSLLPGSQAVKIADRDDEEEEEEPVGLVPASADDAPRESQVQENSQLTGSNRPCGRVIGIIKRNWRQYCGSLEPMKMPGGSGGNVHALFVSADRRIPKIRIQTRQLANLIDKRIIASVDSWEPNSRYPSGHYVRTIGDIGDRATESDVLLIENDINSRPFADAVLACLPPLPWSVSDQDLLHQQRQDLRNLRVFSVDPIGCKDIDDALHCKLMPNGLYEVGVHIADVTNFVHPGTPLDEEASQRGTSVYMVERRIDMLPKPLTEDICSLRADVERLAFSVLWEMTAEAEIVSVSFTKSIIKSSAALSYVEAQARMDDSRLEDALTADLRNMNRLAKIMRQRRIERGALTLASPEVKFEIDTETHDPLDVGMYQVREANQMVEEFMLAANISVAEKILKHFPAYSLLRRHPVPTPSMFEPLLRTAAAVGVHLDISSSKALADSLDHAVGDDPYFNKLIRILATRCMTQAVYFCSGELSLPEFHHYGLAAPLYTHFTSPIRRYADVIVHRLLAAALGLSNLPPQFRDRSTLTSISDNLNYRHRNAQMAGRASVELHTLIFFKNRPMDAEARIVKIQSNGFIVFVPKFGIEGPVYLIGKGASKNASGSTSECSWVVDEEMQTVRASDGNCTFRVLDVTHVHIEVVEPQPNRPKLQLTLVS